MARGAAADGTVTMMAGTVVAGLAAYAWQASGTRTLGSVAFAPVAATWTIAFLVSTVLLAPIEQLATRTMASGADGRAQLAQTIGMLWRLVGAAAIALGAITFLLRRPLFQGNGGYALICLATVLGFGQLLFVRGVLAGERNFAGYGLVSAADALLRFGVGVPLVVLGGSALAFAWTIPAGTLVALRWR
jgi:hypothetical protein